MMDDDDNILMKYLLASSSDEELSRNSGSMHDDSSSMDETSDDNSTDDDATSSRTARSTYDGPSSRTARSTWAERQTQVENSSFNSYLKNADVYKSLGYPGALGSADRVHFHWDKCPAGLSNACTGKEKLPTLAFQFEVSHTKWIMSEGTVLAVVHDIVREILFIYRKTTKEFCLHFFV
jgi:hypothetical protein